MQNRTNKLYYNRSNKIAKAFFFLRKATERKPQIIYVGLKNLYIPIGIKILPKHWDFDKSKIKQVALALPEIDLKSNILHNQPKEVDIISFTNNYLHDLSEFVNNHSNLEKSVLKVEIENYLNGKNEVEQFASDPTLL